MIKTYKVNDIVEFIDRELEETRVGIIYSINKNSAIINCGASPGDDPPLELVEIKKGVIIKKVD